MTTPDIRLVPKTSQETADWLPVAMAAYEKARMRAGDTAEQAAAGRRASQERFVLNAGGLRLVAVLGKGEVANEKTVSYDIFSDERDQYGQRVRIMSALRPGTVVRLNAGKNVLTYRQSLEQAGVHVYQALVEVDGDVIEENNRAIGLTVVRGKPQVLLVDKEEAQAQNLVNALRSQYFDVKLVGPDGLPSTMAAL